MSIGLFVAMAARAGKMTNCYRSPTHRPALRPVICTVWVVASAYRDGRWRRAGLWPRPHRVATVRGGLRDGGSMKRRTKTN